MRVKTANGKVAYPPLSPERKYIERADQGGEFH